MQQTLQMHLNMSPTCFGVPRVQKLRFRGPGPDKYKTSVKFRRGMWLCPVNVVGFVDQIPTTYVGGQIGLPSDRRWPPPAGRPPRAGLGPMGPWAPLAPWGPYPIFPSNYVEFFVKPDTATFSKNAPKTKHHSFHIAFLVN